MTLRLYVVRHAEAGSADSRIWPDDDNRPLSDDGAKAFRKAARGLRELGATVDRMLSSTLVRARQTAEILTERAGWPPAETLAALRPEVPPVKLAQALRAEAPSGSLAIVGHEPQLSGFVRLLSGADTKMKKGAVAVLDAEEIKASGAVLLQLLPPKTLASLR